MNDQELITAVRQSVHGVRMNVPAGQIVGRSRAIRASGHRRLAACITAVAAAGSVVLGLGLSGALGAAPDGRTGTIRTAAFTLTRNANGTDTLTLSNSQMSDPAALQQALAQYGIPALVKTGTYCWSSPAPPYPSGVLTVERPDGTAVRPGPGPRPVRIPANAGNVINSAAMPAGTELFIGYFNSGHVQSPRPHLHQLLHMRPCRLLISRGRRPSVPRQRRRLDRYAAGSGSGSSPAFRMSRTRQSVRACIVKTSYRLTRRVGARREFGVAWSTNRAYVR